MDVTSAVPDPGTPEHMRTHAQTTGGRKENLHTRSRALKQAVASARYLLICEWLGMKPIDTKLTLIDEAIILRGKRLGSDFRDQLDADVRRHPRHRQQSISPHFDFAAVP